MEVLCAQYFSVLSYLFLLIAIWNRQYELFFSLLLHCLHFLLLWLTFIVLMYTLLPTDAQPSKGYHRAWKAPISCSREQMTVCVSRYFSSAVLIHHSISHKSAKDNTFIEPTHPITKYCTSIVIELSGAIFFHYIWRRYELHLAASIIKH